MREKCTGAAARIVAVDRISFTGLVPVRNETRGRALRTLDEAIRGLYHLVPLFYIRCALGAAIWRYKGRQRISEKSTKRRAERRTEGLRHALHVIAEDAVGTRSMIRRIIAILN